jgi:hypothetical protein
LIFSSNAVSTKAHDNKEGQVRVLLLVLLLVVAARAGSTIDLASYKNSKKYTYAEVSHTVGEHEYTFVNIKPAFETDTTCIAAVVIDKRKYVLVDLDLSGARTGVVVPKSQPVEGGLLAVKVSPLDAKTFLVLATGKVVTLPGDYVLIDNVGKTVLTVWDNDSSFQLTVLDYGRMRLIVSTTPIARPTAWYTNGLAYFFKGDDGTFYTLDLFTKKVTKVPSEEKGLEKMSYAFEPSGLDIKGCCSGAVLK